MKLFSNEKKLLTVEKQLEKKQAELRVALEQIMALQDELDRARIDALVSETPLAEQIWQEHQRNMEVYLKDKSDLELQIIELKKRYTELRS